LFQFSGAFRNWNLLDEFAFDAHHCFEGENYDGSTIPHLVTRVSCGVDAAFEQADREQMTAAIQKALFRQNASETYDALFSNEHADKTR
jgi:hypothetical protein